MIDVAAYWERRYRGGGSSGAGSRGGEAEAKARLVNEVVRENGVRTLLDLGVGDGYVARRIRVESYTGYDPSLSALALAREASPDVFLTNRFPKLSERFDLTVSADVLFHLVDPYDYVEYLGRLFAYSDLVLVYGTNRSEFGREHVRHRVWLDDVPDGWSVREIPAEFKRAWLLPEGPLIPKILHRIWLADSPPMPDAFVEAGERWRELHPDWIIQDWAFPPFPLRNRKLWDEAPEGDRLRYRADILRLELLVRYGGVYVDADVVPLRPFDALLEGVSAFAGYSPDRWKGERVVTNAILGAVPSHPWTLRCVARAEDSVREYGGSFTAKVVGPHHVNRCLEPDDDVRVYDAQTLYPKTTKEREAAFSYHMWANRNGIRAV